MVAVSSTMLALGSPAPDFRLPDPWGHMHSRDDFAGAPALLVMFICNHCPYVKHIRTGLAQTCSEFAERGVAVVGVNSNDFDAYPDDAPDRMAEEVSRAGYRFPYLVDETQDTARAYRASCTPDFFLFDAALALAYRGQFDASRPGSDVDVTGAELRAAVDSVLDGRPPAADQRPSMGCNIKWRPGRAPDYFG